MTLQGFFEWMQQEAKYGLFIVLIFVVIFFAAKRAWIALIGAIIGLSVVGIFVLNPDTITGLAEWFNSKLNIGAQ